MSAKKQPKKTKNEKEVEEEFKKASELTKKETQKNNSEKLVNSVSASENYPTNKKLQTTPKEHIIKEYQGTHHKKILLWTMMISLLLIVLFMWGWNLYVKFGDVAKQNEKTGLFDESTSELLKIIDSTNIEDNQIQKTIEDTINREQAKATIKQTIADFFQNSSSTTSSLTVTSTTSTDSTDFNSTTTKLFPTSSEKIVVPEEKTRR